MFCLESILCIVQLVCIMCQTREADSVLGCAVIHTIIGEIEGERVWLVSCSYTISYSTFRLSVYVTCFDTYNVIFRGICSSCYKKKLSLCGCNNVIDYNNTQLSLYVSNSSYMIAFPHDQGMLPIALVFRNCCSSCFPFLAALKS